MAEDFRKYTDPGIYIEEARSPISAAPGISPTVVALVGQAQNYRTYTEVVQLTATTAVQLTKLGITTASIVVKDRFTGVTYALTTDYTIATQPGADATGGTADDTTTITRVGAGTITDGQYVTVTYRYTEPDYYDAIRFTSFSDVVAAYGDPFDSAGAINSKLSLAAYLAFQNGAPELICAAVESAGATPTAPEWTTAIGVLTATSDISLVVPIDGNTATHDSVQAHTAQMALQQEYRIGLVGRDGTGAAVTSANLKSQAAGYSNSRMVLVGPAIVEYYNGVSVINLGGQYAAAAVAGAVASRPVHVPVTRKTITGFWNIPNQETNQGLVELQQAGVLMLFRKRTGEVVVRHGLTTNMTNDYTRELNIVAAKDRLLLLIEDTLDFSDLIGSPITDATPDAVTGAVIGALETAKSAGLIYDYSGVSYRQPPDTPTVIEVKFQYRPTLPLNYIQVSFALDTNVGSTDFAAVGGGAVI